MSDLLEYGTRMTKSSDVVSFLESGISEDCFIYQTSLLDPLQ